MFILYTIDWETKEVVTATVDLQDVRSQRASFNSRSAQAATAKRYERYEIDIALSPEGTTVQRNMQPTDSIKVRYHTVLTSQKIREAMRGDFWASLCHVDVAFDLSQFTRRH